MHPQLVSRLHDIWQILQHQPAWLANLTMLGLCLLACAVFFILATILWIFVLSLHGILRNKPAQDVHPYEL